MTETWKPISTFWSLDHTKKAIVNIEKSTNTYFIDFFINDVYIDTKAFPNNSLYYVEDAAENFTIGVLDVSKTA